MQYILPGVINTFNRVFNKQKTLISQAFFKNITIYRKNKKQRICIFEAVFWFS